MLRIDCVPVISFQSPPNDDNSMTPLDTYEEGGALLSQVIALFDDRLKISVRVAGRNSSVTTIPLDQLEPTIHHRAPYENLFERIISIMFLAGGIFVMISWIKYPPIYANPGFWVGCFFSLVGFYAVRHSFRQIEAAVFVTPKGVPKVTISRIGPDAGRYQDFVERISTQIKLARAGRLAE
jgi:hypothetical protein